MVERDVTQVGNSDVEGFGPVLAVFEIQTGLHFVARGHPDIKRGTCEAGFHDGVEGISFGGADLVGLFPELKVPVVGDPAGLGGQEPRGVGKIFSVEIGRDWSRLVEIRGTAERGNFEELQAGWGRGLESAGPRPGSCVNRKVRRSAYVR